MTARRPPAARRILRSTEGGPWLSVPPTRFCLDAATSHARGAWRVLLGGGVVQLSAGEYKLGDHPELPLQGGR